jgi:hypothetical protein
MKTASRIWIIVVILILCLAARAQENKARDVQFGAISRAIEEGKPEAVIQAGQSGNPDYIPYLKKLLGKMKEQHIDLSGGVFIALARLADKDTLEEVVCRVDSPHPLAQWVAIDDLQRVGGWFSIRLLETKLGNENSNAKFRRGLRKYSKDLDSDVSYSGPDIMALVTFSKVVPNPPMPLAVESNTANSTTAPRLTNAWREWIRANTDALSKLQPVGEGIDLSGKFCQSPKYLKKEKAWRKQAISR